MEDPLRSTAISLDFSEVPYVTFWSDADNFLCIEPCWGLPDSNPPVPFEKKAGIQVIPPGGILKRGFAINPTLLT
jgi:galactose mutarotase-like enzyme